MNRETAQTLLNLSDDNNEWIQELFVIHSDQWLNISSAAMGDSSVTPVGATDQPNTYPPSSVYRFDPKFKGMKTRDQLINMMRLLDTHPGCDVTLRDSNAIETDNRQALLKFCCKQYRKPPDMSKKTFDGKNLAQSNTVHVSLKLTKSSGTKTAGIGGMCARSRREHIASLGRKVKNMGGKPTERRTMSKFVEGSCDMKIIIFLGYDGYWYLSTTSTLKHTYHAHLPMKAIPQNGTNLSENELALLNRLFSVRVKRSTVAHVLEDMKGKDKITLKPKTLYNLRQKSLNTIDIENGFTGDMTDASKALKKIKE